MAIQGPKIVSVDKKGSVYFAFEFETSLLEECKDKFLEEPNCELSLSDSALPNAALEDIYGMGTTSTASFKQSLIRRRAIQCQSIVRVKDQPELRTRG